MEGKPGICLHIVQMSIHSGMEHSIIGPTLVKVTQLWPMKSRKIPRLGVHSRCDPMLDLLHACCTNAVVVRASALEIQ